ncbi:MAG: HAMP domain-containing histidine kinase [Lachnospiraceae bacterium]|nr:HAMP domain-containing histidine kinase [Lachnospiraceae bacterium]
MNKYFRTVLLLAALYVLGLAAVFVFSSRPEGDAEREQDVIRLNEITKDAEACWDELSSLEGKNYGAEFVILSSKNDLLFSSSSEAGGEKLSVESAIRKRYPYSYVIKNGQLAGTVVLCDDGGRAARRMRIVLLAGPGILGLLLFIMALIYGSYIRKRIILPFRELKGFAGKIAEGKLDEPLTMDMDNIFGAFTESFDIMREQLAESREREVALQKKERELVASLSHDLKTPITGIKLTTELLTAGFNMREDKPDTDVIEKLDNIYKKADQIDMLVSDLFSATLDDLGEFRVSCRDEESRILSEILKKYDDRRLVKASAVPELLIRIDSRRMSQVIGNIIVNSYKYANTAIDVDYSIVEDRLLMRIADHGPGVPADELGLITNKFYRGRQWREGSEEGSGLGLYIAKTLMEKMDGDLLAESRGEGLIITLLIPLS